MREKLLDNNGLVRASRAGDAFHYRWAARRCLKMIDPNSGINLIVIEGSKERKLAGEYVIDVAEYKKDSKKIFYYQLKHTTRRLDQPIKLSDIKGTIEGFADRFKKLDSDQVNEINAFKLITNRPVCQNFKDHHKCIADGGIPQSQQFYSTLKKYTGLSGRRLELFCSLLVLSDGEGGYLEQRGSLQAELSGLVAGVVDNPVVDTLIAMVSDKALPDNDGEITKEDVLKRLGVESIEDMFPAPTALEDLNNPISRSQQDELLGTIVESKTSIIIHAEGGVGKSIMCRQLGDALPNDWNYVVYDCFGAGKYRNRSQPRHRYRDIVAQISNELAREGLCEPFIPGNSDLDDALLRSLKTRLSKSLESIRKKSSSANLVIFIDAADNAEMAAHEFSEPCFANQFINEDFPEGCKVVALCRTERVNLLKPKSTVVKKLLKPFSKLETLSHARVFFPEITEEESDELHRLTTGNPRVQSNALSVPNGNLTEILKSLGPSPTTIENQINDQLQKAVLRLKDSLPENPESDIDSICYGLANLPPLIPLEVLATVANVHESLIKSFVSDLGKPLWLSDHSVMFRDEPTETWFVSQFSASKEAIAKYIEILKPLANKSAYVAEAIPSLLLKAGNYSELIELSLSNECLPENPIDARSVRLYRLQYAFKASLINKEFTDASKLAMLAGEEVSSDNRQFGLLRSNIDLLEKLQSKQHVQDLAYRKELKGSWQGSENIYSSSLLSWVPDCKGESKAYLRAAENWLKIYFDQRNNGERDIDIGNLKDREISELVSIYYKLFGVKKVSEFIFKWTPESAISSITPSFFERLVDIEAYDEINSILFNASRDDIIRFSYLCLSATSELWRVNKTLDVSILRECLDIFLQTSREGKKNSFGEPASLLGAICFAESCAHKKVSKVKVRRFLRIYVLKEPGHSLLSEYDDSSRSSYLRSLSLDLVLSNKDKVNLEKLMPKEFLKSTSSSSEKVSLFKQMVGGLLPWYKIRAKVIVGKRLDINKEYQCASVDSSKATSHRYRQYDTLPSEISRVQVEIFLLHDVETTREKFLEKLNAGHIKYRDRIEALRAVARLDIPECISDLLEESCYRDNANCLDGSPEDVSDGFVSLARAVLTKSLSDSKAYFALALDSVSKFGDEITERWYATESIAKKHSELGSEDQEMAFRFIRCAELVGETVAREKYINRNSVVNICASISPSTALSSLSRWRDRGIGFFKEQLVSVMNLFVENGMVSGQVAFAFEAMSENVSSTDLVICCIERAEEKYNKEYILDTYVRNVLMEDTGLITLNKLNDLCERVGLENRELMDAISHYQALQSLESGLDNQQELRKINNDKAKYDYVSLLKDLDLTIVDGIDEAISRFKSIQGMRSSVKFWQHCFKEIGSGNASILLQNTVLSEAAGSYDVEYAIENIPIEWRVKPAVKRVMPKVVLELTKKFSVEYASQYRVNHLEKILDDSSLNEIIQSGLFSGLGENSQLFGAQTLFSFAELATNNISPYDAGSVLDTVLSRWELHIDDDFSDGKWSDWLVTNDLSMSLVSLVWSALGAPESSTRWAATHVIRRLVETNCTNEVDALISLINTDEVGPYGCKNHIFYDLHAKQYLLIALSRVSLSNAKYLKKHSTIFIDLATNSPHVLIQHLASLVALNLAKYDQDIYEPVDIRALRKVNHSNFKPINVESVYRTSLNSPWHEEGTVAQDIDIHLSYDFGRYWYEPLGRVFGIPSSQVEDLAKEIIVKNFKGYTGHYLDDKRSERSYGYTSPSHSHGSYPSVDNYAFYVSYHAMFMVAKMLLDNMPLLQSSFDDEIEDGWFAWLSRHLLTLSDGGWLSDRRDTPPLEKRDWLLKKQNEDWLNNVSDEDFLYGLIRFDDNNNTWLNLYGTWNECNSSMDELYIITSALVNKETSNALLSALTTCSEPHNFKLPDYLEDHLEIQSGNFKLNGWINDYESDKRLDSFDYYSGDFSFPPLSLGQSFVDSLELNSDSSNRYWFQNSNKNYVVCSLCWGAKPKDKFDRYVRRGKRIVVEFEFIKSALKKLEKDLIIEVQINRSIVNYPKTKEENEIKYSPAYSKIYILSGDGELRDTTKSYQVGRENC